MKKLTITLAVIIGFIMLYFLATDGSKSNPPALPEKPQINKTSRDHTYIIFLSGLNTCCDGTPYNKMGFEFFRRRFQHAGLAYNDEHFLQFSYTGGYLRRGKWHPNPYKPKDTGQPLEFSVLHLRDMINEFSRYHPGAQFLLVGHSLGGRIAFDYVTQYHLEKTNPIKGLVTLNSPLTGSIHVRPDLLAHARPIWGSVAVRQLAAEYQLQDDLGIINRKREVVRKLTEKGMHVATFGTKQDVIVDPLTACLTDKEGRPLTEGVIVSVNPLNGSFDCLFGHHQILKQAQVADYIISVYMCPNH